MADLVSQLKVLLLVLLRPDDQKTAAHLVEELRVEHPDLFQMIIDTYTKEYNLSGCGAQMSPSTVVLQTLKELHQDGAIVRTQFNSTSLWHKER